MNSLKTALAAISLSFVVLLGACVRAAPSPTAPAASAPAAVAPAPALRGVLVAGTSGDYPPLSAWTGARPEGFAPALLDRFAEGRTTMRWERFRWPELVADLRAGKFAIAADGITVRAERSVAGRFTLPIALGGAVLLTRTPASSVRDLDRPGVRIAVNRGGHLERVARRLFRAADVQTLERNQDVRAELARGGADAAMTNTFEAPRWMQGLEGQVTALGPLTHDVTALWVRAEDAELADRLDDWLLEEEESGRLAELRTRWLGPGAGPRSATPVVALFAATAERLMLMPFVAAAKQREGRVVEDPAQEERVLNAATEQVAKAAAARDARRATPPRPDTVRAFFRAQIEAAKVVQANAARELPSSPVFALDTELRPAIARISARMARLVARIPRGLRREEVMAAGAGLVDPTLLEPIATAMVALGQ